MHHAEYYVWRHCHRPCPDISPCDSNHDRRVYQVMFSSLPKFVQYDPQRILQFLVGLETSYLQGYIKFIALSSDNIEHELLCKLKQFTEFDACKFITQSFNPLPPVFDLVKCLTVGLSQILGVD